ncbi:craniofacial development protein 2-like [Neltuma alba]|uniref:craniofacial development protein 2-like n=1 Tax=Neltuma alba TaxID=207710 RepID=UPI0010A51A46|nr:craniofacial development protein 2-like [Prosopis alba]
MEKFPRNFYARNDVGIIIDRTWKKHVVEIKRFEDRIISLSLIVGKDNINIISVYAPQVRVEVHLKGKFWKDLKGLVQSIPLAGNIFIGGDLNGHVGKKVGQFAGAYNGLGFGELNNRG